MYKKFFEDIKDMSYKSKIPELDKIIKEISPKIKEYENQLSEISKNPYGNDDVIKGTLTRYISEATSLLKIKKISWN